MVNLKEIAIKRLEERGVTIHDIALIVYDLQKQYTTITHEYCQEIVLSVLEEKEVIYAILTGIAIDKAAETNLLDKEVVDLITNDKGIYGIDEILALSIVNRFGSIALTNFGYLDKEKPYIIGRIDQLGKEKRICTTFLDDIVAAIVAACSSTIANK